MFKPQTKDKRLIDELKQKNIELEEEVVRLESELIRLSKRLDFEYQRGFSYGHNEGANKYLEILARQEQLKTTRILVVSEEKVDDLRKVIAESKNEAAGIVTVPNETIILITEEDKKREVDPESSERYRKAVWEG